MFDYKKIAFNIKSLRISLGMSQNDFAQKLDVNLANIRDLEIGKVKASVEILYKIKAIFDIDIDGLVTGLKKSTCSSSFLNNSFVIRYFPEVAASAGAGAYVDNEYSEPFTIDRSLVKNPNTCAVIGVTGTSMEPTLLDGDKILISTNREELCKLIPDHIYVVNTDGTTIVKRYSGREGSVCYFTSDNRIFSQYRIDLADEANRIVGVLQAIIYRQSK